MDTQMNRSRRILDDWCWLCNELDSIFLNLLVRQPICSLMEALFREGVEQCGMNVLRSGRGVRRSPNAAEFFLLCPIESPSYHKMSSAFDSKTAIS